jgi:DNA-binding beta-propeller fold protein YncE
MARNNYFTGKLLVERDFTDEQRYTMGKLRRHNQRLHGWGTVCGLKVCEHPIPACQPQYVVVKPGTAIDCCGREILLTCEEYVDFEAKFLAQWQQQYGPNSTPDNTTAHTIQICISYKECPTENVPALFDDCSGGAGACQPNRILESHSFDVIIDPPASAADPQAVELNVEFPWNVANAVKVAEDDASDRMYVLTSPAPGVASTATLYVIETTHYALLTSVSFASSLGLDVAVSPAGDYFYVAVQPVSATGVATGPPTVNVYEAANFSVVGTPLSVGANPDPTVHLAIFPGTEGSLFAFGQVANVVGWTNINVTPAPIAITWPAATPPVAMVVSSNNQYAYVATSGSGSISVLTLSSMTVTGTNNIPLNAVGTAVPISLALASTTAGDMLAALDKTNSTLYFVNIPTTGPSSTLVPLTVTTFAYANPTQVLLSPGGRWAYVLEQDAANNAYIQVVDEHAVASGLANAVGSAVAVGVVPQSETISQDGTHLYIPYQNVAPNPGGVAIVDVTQADCSDIFQSVIDCCPDCDQGNCLVLATISNYVYQSAVTKTSIDNLTDRRLLVSTDVLTKAVQCLIDQGCCGGTTAQQGPVAPSLTCIQDINWPHNGTMTVTSLETVELLIAFSGSVQYTDINSDSVIVLQPIPVTGAILGTQPIVWTDMGTTIAGGNFAPAGAAVISQFKAGADANGLANGISLTFSIGTNPNPNGYVRVIVKGDFIRDASATRLAVDGDHLPPWLPGRPTGDGIEGGTFESWLTVQQSG